MALDSYTNLKTEIAAWMARSDLTSYTDTFIDLFEAWANRNLRMRQMEGEATSPAEEYMALPADFMQLRDVQFQAAQRAQLSYVTPEYADLYDPSGATGVPKYYTIIGDQLRLVPAPSSTTDVRILYWKQITPLSSGNESNWLLSDYPDAYLYGSLIHARAFLTDVGVAEWVKSGWAQVMAEIQVAGKRASLGGSLTQRAA